MCSFARFSTYASSHGAARGLLAASPAPSSPLARCAWRLLFQKAWELERCRLSTLDSLSVRARPITPEAVAAASGNVNGDERALLDADVYALIDWSARLV